MNKKANNKAAPKKAAVKKAPVKKASTKKVKAVAPAPAPAQITADDLKMLVSMIDVGSTRGSWRGDELGSLAYLREKLTAHVVFLSPPVQPVDEVKS